MSAIENLNTDFIEVNHQNPKIRNVVELARVEYGNLKRTEDNKHKYCVAIRTKTTGGEELILGRRFYLMGLMFDVSAEVIQLVESTCNVSLPLIKNKYLRLSKHVIGEQYRYISCLERCTVNGKPVEAIELTTVEDVMTLLGLYDSLDVRGRDKLLALPTQSKVVKQSSTPSTTSVVTKNEVVKKSSTSPTTSVASQNEVVKESSTSVTTTPVLQGEELENLKYLPLIYQVLQEINDKLSIQPTAPTAIINTVETLTEVVDNRFKSKIGVEDSEDAQAYLIVAFAKIEEYKAKGLSETKAIQAVTDEGLVAGSEFNELMLKFQSSRSRKGKGYVTFYNLQDYYKNRYSVVDGKVINNLI